MLEFQINIYFYDWYEKHHNQCNLINKKQCIREDKTTISSNHPPLESIVITVKNNEIIASPFKLADGNNDSSKIIQQNNFTNQYLSEIGKQLNSIESSLDNHGIDQRIQPKLDKPLINLPSNRKNLSLPNNDKEIAKRLDKMLGKLKIKEDDPKSLAVMDKGSSSNNDKSDSDNSTINDIENQFKKLSFSKTNPTSLTKNWYLGQLDYGV